VISDSSGHCLNFGIQESESCKGRVEGALEEEGEPSSPSGEGHDSLTLHPPSDSPVLTAIGIGGGSGRRRGIWISVNSPNTKKAGGLMGWTKYCDLLLGGKRVREEGTSYGGVRMKRVKTMNICLNRIPIINPMTRTKIRIRGGLERKTAKGSTPTFMGFPSSFPR